VAAGDVSRDTARRAARAGRATARGAVLCGLATGLGAWTVMPGRVLLPEGSVAAIAAPLRPNVTAENDETATTRPEKKRDESRIAKSFDQGGHWQGEHVLVGAHRHRFLSRKEEKRQWKCPMCLANFRLRAVLKFSMSARQIDTLRYKIVCRLPRRLGTVACMGNSDHILVVDDDLGLRELLDRYFAGHGYRVTTVANGRQMRDVLANHRIDLIVLDLMLPGDDGLTLCRNLRANQAYDIPILMLTARGDEADRIVGLEMGADDYLTKPFAPRELLARIRSVLRRAEMLPRNLAASEKARLFRFGEWKLDTAGRFLVDSDGTVVSLSGAEYRLLRVFLDHPQHVLNRDQLLDLTQGREAEVFDRSIDLLVSRLRQRLRDDAREPSYIKTVRSEGYVFAVAVEALPEPS
jgi:two-component system, OmpR family, response regulator